MLRRITARFAPQDAPTVDDVPDEIVERAEIAELLAAVRRIPREELPDGAARDALMEAARCGEIDNLYTPVARDRHNVTLAHLAADVDPRITVEQWATWWLGGKSPSDELLAEHAAAVERGRAFWEAREEQARVFLQQRQGQQHQQASEQNEQDVTLRSFTPNFRRRLERGEGTPEGQGGELS